MRYTSTPRCLSIYITPSSGKSNLQGCTNSNSNTTTTGASASPPYNPFDNKDTCAIKLRNKTSNTFQETTSKENVYLEYRSFYSVEFGSEHGGIHYRCYPISLSSYYNGNISINLNINSRHQRGKEAHVLQL